MTDYPQHVNDKELRAVFQYTDDICSEITKSLIARLKEVLKSFQKLILAISDGYLISRPTYYVVLRVRLTNDVAGNSERFH